MRRSFPDGVTAHQRRYVQRGVVKAKVDLKCVVVVRQRSVYSSIDGLFRRIRLVGRAHRSSSKQAERGIRSLMITIKKYGSILDTTVKNIFVAYGYIRRLWFILFFCTQTSKVEAVAIKSVNEVGNDNQ